MLHLDITVPDSTLSALQRSPAEFAEELKLAAAIHWYQRGAMSQERAAELAGLNRRDFIRALAREGIDVFNLDIDSLARELAREHDRQ
jgi:predicted HTH domain antitoxin